MLACPVCGAPDGLCTGDAPFDPGKVIDLAPKGATVAEDTKVYLPKQHVRRGVAGYKGDDVVVVDTDGSRQSAREDAARNAKVVATGTVDVDRAAPKAGSRS